MKANEEELITFLRNHVDFKGQSNEISNWTTFLDESKNEFMENYKKQKLRTFVCKDFEYLNVIGKGSFGKILLGRNKITKEYFAIKVIDKTSKSPKLENEKKIWSSLQCPFIVEMSTYYENKTALYLVLQLIPGGDLSLIIDRFGRLAENVSRFYAAQVLLALEYLHYLDIVYRDIKPENILIDGRGYIKVTDFGLSKYLKKGRAYTLCGTPEYMAPEILLSKGYGKSVDYWSFGILLFELNSGNTPYYTKSNYFTFAKIAAGNYRMETFFSDDLKDLIFNLLQVNLSNRIGLLKNGINDIKDHIWFGKLVWLQVANKNLKPPYVPSMSDIQARIIKATSSQ